MSRERCSTCRAVLVWANHRLVCPRPHCPGHHENGPDALTQPECLGAARPSDPEGPCQAALAAARPREDSPTPHGAKRLPVANQTAPTNPDPAATSTPQARPPAADGGAAAGASAHAGGDT